MDDREREEEALQMAPAERGSEPLELGPNTAIGRRLKAYYEDVASEPIPDRFLTLLDALDAAELASKRSS
ncbi:NepR family anti-sigma factor [Consotaella aegiceratis]|uniref:NepR family anti-sigma factor n=1 Tax=Consotaella aegiceratis TaxID=3097961 RepID=UPI002F3ED8AF